MSASFDKASIMSTLTDGMKMKAQMIKKGLTAARVRCPQCDGFLHAPRRPQEPPSVLVRRPVQTTDDGVANGVPCCQFHPPRSDSGS